jgi:hypothetical protein
MQHRALTLFSRGALRRTVCCVPLACLLHGGSVHAGTPQAGGKAKKAERPPQVERITDNVYRIGGVIVDTQARTVTCKGVINMDQGAIEYLAVAPGGKTHESLLRIDVRPLHLQVALLMLDLEPKNVLKYQGDPRTPQGAPVEIRVRWHDLKGAEQEARAEELILEVPAKRPMPPNRWVFTGSRILKEGFEADLAKSLVAVYHDPAAILDNPLPGGVSNNYIVYTKRVPKQGTAIDFVLKALPPASPSSSAARPVSAPAQVAWAGASR